LYWFILDTLTRNNFWISFLVYSKWYWFPCKTGYFNLAGSLSYLIHQSYLQSPAFGLPNCVLRLWLSSNSFFNRSSRRLRIWIDFNYWSTYFISSILSFSYYINNSFYLSNLYPSCKSVYFSSSFSPALYRSWIVIHWPNKNLIGKLRIWASIISKFIASNCSSYVFSIKIVILKTAFQPY